MVKQKGRGVWLTIWLSFMLIGGIFSAFSNLLLGRAAYQLNPSIPLWSYTLFGIFSILNIIFIIYLFLWKKWAFYAILASAVVVFIVNVYVGVSAWLALLGFLGVIILYLSMRSRWKSFN